MRIVLPDAHPANNDPAARIAYQDRRGDAVVAWHRGFSIVLHGLGCPLDEYPTQAVALAAIADFRRRIHATPDHWYGLH